MGLPSQQVSMDVWWQGDLLPLARPSEGLPWRIVGLCRVWGRWLGCLPQRHELHLGSFRCCWQTLSVWVLKHVKLYIMLSSTVPTLISMRCLGVADYFLSFGKKKTVSNYTQSCGVYFWQKQMLSIFLKLIYRRTSCLCWSVHPSKTRGTLS